MPLRTRNQFLYFYRTVASFPTDTVYGQRCHGSYFSAYSCDWIAVIFTPLSCLATVCFSCSPLQGPQTPYPSVCLIFGGRRNPFSIYFPFPFWVVNISLSFISFVVCSRSALSFQFYYGFLCPCVKSDRECFSLSAVLPSVPFPPPLRANNNYPPPPVYNSSPRVYIPDKVVRIYLSSPF